MEKIKFKITFKDYLLASKIILNKNIAFNFFRILFIILSIIHIYFMITTYVDFNSLFVQTLAIIYIFLPNTVLPLINKRLYEQQIYFKHEIELEFYDDYIIEKSIVSECKFKWLFKHIIAKDMLLMYNTPKTFMILHKKYCTGSDQFNRILDIIGKIPQGAVNLNEKIRVKN